MPSLAWTEQALGTGAKVRILRVLSGSPDREFLEAEIARATGMSPNTVNLAVRELARAGVLRLNAVGRSHGVRLAADAPFGRAVMQLFESEREAFRELVRSMKAVLPRGVSCVLFGSAARGGMRAGSDLDILLVAPSYDMAAETSLRIRERTQRVHPGPCRILHYTPADLRKRRGTAFLENVLRDGLLIGGRPLEDVL